MKFKRGDVVWCKKQGVYLITSYHVVCEVTEVYGVDLVVKVLDGPRAGCEYGVDARHFEFVRRKAVIV